MKLNFRDDKTGGDLLFFKGEKRFDRQFFSKDHFNKYFTVAWNPGRTQTVTIDREEFDFPSQSMLTLLFNQSFNFEKSEEIIAWQFNREFYCIIDHDSEVSCVGFLFNNTDHLFIPLIDVEQRKLQLLSDIFIEEFNTTDNIQNEVLLVLLKRLIIYVTKLAKTGYKPAKKMQEERFHTIRKFNLLVEKNFKAEHSVNFYAQQLCKSPKTLSNLFAAYNNKSPSHVIQERIIIEAKRLLTYTDKPIKHITFDLGFEDVSYFSNFFKKHMQLSPHDFRNNTAKLKEGK
jgi:AraC family transcriptional regulator, transcriptional activator of pobA